ncbi:hypothetical protein HGM15179_020622 [Zosterops borbonicus]|uniref:Peptidase A2 domain-containing protein n=1 Tax=Zosterops borbonicus TaxID=364589 RepID=A0A8K1D782_9PASS|nr:hypothetical protein HGM15179_020622 [Zosterops borbonicus]
MVAALTASHVSMRRIRHIAFDSLVIQPAPSVAVKVESPLKRNKRAERREVPLKSFNPPVRWIKCITNEEPEQTCSLTHLGKTVHITGKLDTGADVTVISYEFWPSNWNLVPPEYVVTGIGGSIVCMQSESMITVTGPEGKTAKIRPLVVKKRITVWGRDVMSQWRTKMEVDS